jgi:DNA repair protein RadC
MKTLNNYKFCDNSLILDNFTKTYTLKIRDLPSEEKPREKLMNNGASCLSVAELLAIVLGTGSKKEEVLAMSERILKEYGEKGLVSQKNPQILSKDLDIPLIKAIQLIACSELGKRFFAKNENGLSMIRTAKDVFEYVKDMRELPKENLRGIYLNAHHKVIHDEIISIGTVDSNIIHPREVFKPALEYSAVAVILVHNHPSGEINPSQADRDITEQLIKVGKILGIDLLDHVIVTKDNFFSIPVQY